MHQKKKKKKKTTVLSLVIFALPPIYSFCDTYSKIEA